MILFYKDSFNVVLKSNYIWIFLVEEMDYNWKRFFNVRFISFYKVIF